MADSKQIIKETLTDPAFVLDKLGLLDTAKKARTGYAIPCLWHQENEPSCSVRQHPNDGTLSAHCFGCGGGGDVFDLIAKTYELSASSQFPEVLKIAADFAGVSLDDNSPPVNRKPPKRMPPRPPEYPPVDDLKKMWGESLPPDKDPESEKWFVFRGLDMIKLRTLCRVIPLDYDLPQWAIFKDDESGRYDWIMSGHRLIFPLYDHYGKIKSFKARCLHDGKLKNVNPLGYSTANLCFASDDAREMLYSGRHSDRVIFAEGEVDYLNAVQRYDNTAVFGIYSGCWSDAHSSALKCNRWFFTTDVDAPGDKYAEEITKSIKKNRS